MRRISLALLIAVAPVGIQGQASGGAAAPPNPIMLSYKLFGGRYAGWLIAALDSIPERRYGYKPTPAQQSIGYIAQHVESANYELCEVIGGAKHVMTARDSLADTVKATWPKDTLLARLKASVHFCGQAGDKLTDVMLADQVPVGPPGSGRTTARASYLNAFITDLAEHYAQVASYMRLMGLTPPSALPRPKPEG